MSPANRQLSIEKLQADDKQICNWIASPSAKKSIIQLS